MGIEQSLYNLYLLYNNITQFSIIGLQTDDTLFLINNKFATLEEDKLYKIKFIAKEYK